MWFKIKLAKYENRRIQKRTFYLHVFDNPGMTANLPAGTAAVNQQASQQTRLTAVCTADQQLWNVNNSETAAPLSRVVVTADVFVPLSLLLLHCLLRKFSSSCVPIKFEI